MAQYWIFRILNNYECSCFKSIVYFVLTTVNVEMLATQNKMASKTSFGSYYLFSYFAELIPLGCWWQVVLDCDTAKCVCCHVQLLVLSLTLHHPPSFCDPSRQLQSVVRRSFRMGALPCEGWVLPDC